MKVKLPPAYAALRALSKSVDPTLGEPMRFRSIDALKRAVRIEDVIAHCLEQETQEVRGELRFHCLPTWHGGPDNNPSLWVNVEKQKWGCNACGLPSDDVVGFLRKFHSMDHAEALEWLRIWAYGHPLESETPRIRIRLSKRGRR